MVGVYRMNRKRQDKAFKGQLLPLRLDSFWINETYKEYEAEYDGWHFEGRTIKAVMNKILKYIFEGGEK